MPRYCFDLCFNDDDSSEDEEGVELDVLKTPHIEAARALSDFYEEIVRSGRKRRFASNASF